MKLSMLSRHGDVVEKNIHRGMAPRHREVSVKQESCTLVGPATHDEQCRPRGQRFHSFAFINRKIGCVGSNHCPQIVAKLLSCARLGAVGSPGMKFSVHVPPTSKLVTCWACALMYPLRYRSRVCMRTSRPDIALRSALPRVAASGRGLVAFKKLKHLVRIYAGKGAGRQCCQEACGR